MTRTTMTRGARWACALGGAMLLAGTPGFAEDEFHPEADTGTQAEKSGPEKGDTTERSDTRDRFGRTDSSGQEKSRAREGERQTGETTGAMGQTGATGEGEYVVRKGDTLSGIAEEELGSADKWQVIARANGIDDPKKLEVGRKLNIPAEGAASGQRRGGMEPSRSSGQGASDSGSPSGRSGATGSPGASDPMDRSGTSM